jgi:hypothetical protein
MSNKKAMRTHPTDGGRLLAKLCNQLREGCPPREMLEKLNARAVGNPDCISSLQGCLPMALCTRHAIATPMNFQLAIIWARTLRRTLFVWKCPINYPNSVPHPYSRTTTNAKLRVSLPSVYSTCSQDSRQLGFEYAKVPDL